MDFAYVDVRDSKSYLCIARFVTAVQTQPLSMKSPCFLSADLTPATLNSGVWVIDQICLVFHR